MLVWQTTAPSALSSVLLTKASADSLAIPGFLQESMPFVHSMVCFHKFPLQLMDFWYKCSKGL